MNYQCYFPRYGKKSDEKLINIIKQSKRTLDIAIFNFTDPKILDAILEAKKQGVRIRVITDKMMAITPIQYYFLRKMKNAGIQIKKNAHPGFMHLKMTISDENTATVASANFTKSSQIKNDEVFLVFREKSAVDNFCKQFELMWNMKEDFKPF